MKLEDWLPELVGELERWSHLGDRRFDTGGRFIGHLPQQGEFAWLHRLYPPQELSELHSVEQAIGGPIPDSFVELLLYMNGCWLFYPLLSIFGNILRFDRNSIEFRMQPISLRYGNTWERARNLSEGAVCIGRLTGYRLLCPYYISADGSVRLVRSNDGAYVAAEWPSLGEMLVWEVRRLGILHDDQGNLTVSRHEIWPERARGWDSR